MNGFLVGFPLLVLIMFVLSLFVLSLVGSIPGAIIGCRGGKFRWCYLGAFVGALLAVIASWIWLVEQFGPIPGGHW